VKSKVVLQPIVSEKSFELAEANGKYCFKVVPSANKIEIANTIAKLFDVTVTSVKTLNMRARKVRFGKNRRMGKRSVWKKAIVTLKEGDKIDLFEVK